MNFFDYFDVQSIESYLTESFSQAEILEKQWRLKNKPKSCMVAMATYMRADWWN